MPKMPWSELLARCPGAHVLVASFPDTSDEERLANARAQQQLLERLLRKLRIDGGYAVTVSRSTGQREIVCAFGSAEDLHEAARATGATSIASHEGRSTRYHVLLDDAAQGRIMGIAGPPTVHRTPRRSLLD